MHLGGGGGGKAATSLPSNLHSAHAWLDSDMLLRFDDPELESRFARHNGEVQAQGEHEPERWMPCPACLWLPCMLLAACLPAACAAAA
jgi:hypothetical protein